MARVLVTVGTTEFRALVLEATSPAVLRELARARVRELVVQHGRGPEPVVGRMSEEGAASRGALAPPDAPSVTWFSLRASLREEMAAADVVVSHAGAGSVMEALRMRKRLIVVVNDELMDNHQLELADAVERAGFAVKCASPAELLDGLRRVLADLAAGRPVEPYPERRPELFARALDEVPGLW